MVETRVHKSATRVAWPPQSVFALGIATVIMIRFVVRGQEGTRPREEEAQRRKGKKKILGTENEWDGQFKQLWSRGADTGPSW